MSEGDVLEVFPYLKEKKKVKITVLKIFDPEEVFKDPPVEHVEPWGPCPIFTEGQELIVSESGGMPEGFCTSAWQTIWGNVRTLSFGGNFPYFKKEKGAIISCCSDGLRPVIFKLERLNR
jgi:uncharacterized repeat protein (TIGR04076 family)